MVIRRKNQYPRAGDLNREILVKTPNFSADGQGGRTVSSYTTAATIWADVKPVRGSRLSEYGMTINEKPREIRILKPVWSGAPGYTIDETVLLTLKDDSIDLIVHDVMDIDDLGQWLMIIATERK